jgi:Ser/Thr protein kinase RdoA (MazF antagonist)
LADVYEWEEGTVLKLYRDAEARERTEREYTAARAVHLANLPAPHVQTIVEIDGKTGLVFEKVQGSTALTQVQARPWTLFTAVRHFAELHVQIHACKAPAELPSQREWIARGIDRADGLSET